MTFAAYAGDVLTGGDAKWYPDVVPVTPGSRYLYQDAYQADTDTHLVAAFFSASREHLSNVGHILVVPTGDTWKTASASFIAPPGAAYMLVYHQLSSVGTLTMDNIMLMEIPLQTMFDRGFVSLTFDDGYLSQYENARSILNAAGVKATFYAVSHNSGFGVLNPSFETSATGDATKPFGWSHAGGANSTYTYPALGRSGQAAALTATEADSVSGWRSDPVTILADQSHEFSHYYKSTGSSTLYIEVNQSDGTLAYIQSDGDLGTLVTPFATLPPAADWTQYKSPEIWIPPAVKSIRVRYNLVATGTLAIDDVNMGAYHNFMMPTHLRDLQNDQHEIGGHSETHADLTGVPFAEARDEIQGSRTELLAGGFTPVLTFAYPLGNNNEAIQTEVAGAGYTSARATAAPSPI
jgi:peptidoglycan/xylan/chitin deacetylase (PgdA/CDA1 family)